MNNSLRFAPIVALSMAWSLATVPALAQRGAAPAATAGDRIAVIDINYIFKNHTRFKEMVEDWKEDVRAADAEMKRGTTRIEGMVDDLKRYVPGSDDFKRREEAIAKERAALQVQMQIKKKDLMIREAKTYLKVYQEVQQQVTHFAKQHGITLVLRFNRGPVNSEDPRQIQQVLLRPVVFQDRIDITDQILKYLNPPGGGQPSGNMSRPSQGNRIPARR